MSGASNQTAPATDLVVATAVRNQLFQKRGQGRPDDLVSRNLQRGREHGIPSYSELRTACGMSVLTSQAPPEITRYNFGCFYCFIDMCTQGYLGQTDDHLQ